jgi:heat-inducible transcriptional repressor
MTTSNREELDARQRMILASVVRQYILSGTPVGSKAVADQTPEQLSPATVRNCMADLEDNGFLKHPHVSAGRVPTDKAYRFYVDRIVGMSRLPTETEHYIRQHLTAETLHPERLMATVSHVLAEVSHNVGLVLGPALEEKVLEHVKFVKLPDHRILAVIVSKPDLIENKIIRLDEEMSQRDLDRTADYLNAEFRGWSLGTIRLEIFKRLEEMKQLFDQLLSNVAKLLMWGALAEESPGPLFIEGTAQFLDLADFEDVHKVKRLLETFEEKAKLVKILSACLEGRGVDVRILIGKENPTREMHECALIMAPYRYRNRAVGALGVVGPMRMEYERAITTVSYVAHLCTKLLSAN